MLFVFLLGRASTKMRKSMEYQNTLMKSEDFAVVVRHAINNKMKKYLHILENK